MKIAVRALPAVLLITVLVGLSFFKVTPVGRAINAYVTSVVTAPSPTPVVVVESGPPEPAPIVLPPVVIPSPTPVTPEPAAFPAIPPQMVVPTAGAAPVAVSVPQTNVFIQILSINGVTGTVELNHQFGDPDTGGYKGPAPFTVQVQANFQGGFNGISPTFKWSDGNTGQTDTTTYTTPGTYHSPTVQAFEVYQGVTYMVGTANANITFGIL